MEVQGQSFDDALKTAQEMGYAEADPTADVEGIDACRKTAILADLAFGYNMDPVKIPTRGITMVTSADQELASALGFSIKLLGRAVRAPGGCCAFVEPHLVPASHLLASVSGVMNACVIRGSAVGEVMFYGPGAGRRPTASAVAADIVDAAQHVEHRKDTDLGAPGGVLAPADSLVSRWYVRSPDDPAHIRKHFPAAEPVYGSSQECGFLTEPMDRRSLKKKLAAVKAAAAYRVLE